LALVRATSRRAFIQSLSAGLGSVGLLDTLAQQGALAAPTPAALPLGMPQFAAKARHNIVLFMPGGPSQMDLFDPKPALQKYAGQRPPSVNLRTERTTGGLLPSPFAFKKYGQCGTEVSELLPQLASMVDDLCVVRSMYTFNPTHNPARALFHSGNINATRPSLGAWLDYGLGSENQNLPGFVLLSPGGGNGAGARSGFLPAKHQGIGFDCSQTEPEQMIRYLQNKQMSPPDQRRQLDLVQQLNRDHEQTFGQDEFLEGRIQAMETAYRMQAEATDAFDIRKEPEPIRAEYGNTSFGHGCLLARRLVERGVRSVHVYYGPGQPWDDHNRINKGLRGRCPDMDQASAALIRDLKRRGLLDETAVVWGGEFGRTPVSESSDGRDHNPYGYTMFMSGGGFKGGVCHGATDEFGFKAVENRVSVHDLHATLLRVLGIDHERLTYRYAGRDFRLTDVYGEIVHELLA
jgi:hypothetical protein